MPEKFGMPLPPPPAEHFEDDDDTDPSIVIKSRTGLAPLVAAALALTSHDRPTKLPLQPPPSIVAGRMDKVMPLPEAPKSYFDDKSEYFVRHPRGEYSAEERRRRTHHIRPGLTLFYDGDLPFYFVRDGDTLISITQRLIDYDRKKFGHLDKQRTQKLQWFNIPAQKLQPGMWLPIPLENEDRHLTDVQFTRSMLEAVREMAAEPGPYQKRMQMLLEQVPEKDVVIGMIAIAKQESGGRPFGLNELHRWEPAKHAFSFSYFHVLMEAHGSGVKARRNLEMTEGQLYHPKNAGKIFLAFLFEKMQAAKVPTLFPISHHVREFAHRYNGHWEIYNPAYPSEVARYSIDAEKLFEQMTGEPRPERMAELTEILARETRDLQERLAAKQARKKSVKHHGVVAKNSHSTAGKPVGKNVPKNPHKRQGNRGR